MPRPARTCLLYFGFRGVPPARRRAAPVQVTCTRPAVRRRLFSARDSLPRGREVFIPAIVQPFHCVLRTDPKTLTLPSTVPRPDSVALLTPFVRPVSRVVGAGIAWAAAPPLRPAGPTARSWCSSIVAGSAACCTPRCPVAYTWRRGHLCACRAPAARLARLPVAGAPTAARPPCEGAAARCPAPRHPVASQHRAAGRSASPAGWRVRRAGTARCAGPRRRPALARCCATGWRNCRSVGDRFSAGSLRRCTRWPGARGRGGGRAGRGPSPPSLTRRPTLAAAERPRPVSGRSRRLRGGAGRPSARPRRSAAGFLVRDWPRPGRWRLTIGRPRPGSLAVTRCLLACGPGGGPVWPVGPVRRGRVRYRVLSVWSVATGGRAAGRRDVRALSPPANP